MRGSTAALVAILLIAIIGAAAYFLVLAPATPPTNDTTIPPTIIVPDVQILEAANDIPANTLIRASDYEALFQTVEVPASNVTEDDIRASEFSTYVAGQVTTLDIFGGDRIKRSLFRPAGIVEQLPTPAPGEGSRKAMWVYITDLGNITTNGTVDIIASYNIESKYLRFTGSTLDEGVPVISLLDDTYSDVSTKVIAQNVPVLSIAPPVVIGPDGLPVQPGTAPGEVPLEPTPFIEGQEPIEGEVQPTEAPVAIQGTVWGVWLAVTDQEAELIDFTRLKFGTLTLIFRRADDNEQVVTTGVTMDILMRLYGVPQPYAQPNILVDLVTGPAPPLPPNQPPVVIPVPPPFGPGQAVPLPTAAPAEATP